jgi:hypothetical protein
MPEKRTQADVRAEVQKLLEEIERRKERAEREGLAFAALNEEELAQKIRGETSNSPFVYAYAWTGQAAPGTPASVEIIFENPDYNAWVVSETIFFGLPILDLAAATATRDTRWPYVSDGPQSVGVYQAAAFTFNYTTPMAERGTYFGNGVLWRGAWAGTYFDRTIFPVVLV